jgi:hypothetical protein
MHRLQHTNRFSIALLALLAALLSACEVVPYQPQPAPVPAPYPPVVYSPPPQPAVVYPTQPPPPPPSAVYSSIQQCRADNRRAHVEVLDAYERARRAGRIDPAEAQRFAAMDTQLRNVAFQLERDGLNMAECQYISNELSRVRTEVYRMSRSDPALARCLDDNRQAHQDTLAIYENARQSGRIPPNEAQRFNAVEGWLQNYRRDLARDGLTMQDCQRLSGAIAQQREEVLRMSRHDSLVQRCMADNRRAHDTVYSIYNDALRAGRIDGYEAQQFAAIDQRLRRYQADIQRDGVRLEDCQRLGNAIARERAAVDGMARY